MSNSEKLKYPAGSYSVVETRALVLNGLVPTIDFRRANTVMLYDTLSMSGNSISLVAGISRKTVYDRVRKAGKEVRPSLKNPQDEASRVEEHRRVFRERGKEIMAKVHTPENTARRISAVDLKYKTDPTFKENQRIARHK